MTVAADATWQGTAKRYVRMCVCVELIGAAVLALIAALPVLLRWDWGVWAFLPLATVLVVTVWSMLLLPRRVRAIGFQLREDDLLFRHGVIVRTVVAAPYGRLQTVNGSRGPITRAFGLAELELCTASSGSNIKIPGLSVAAAESLRDELVALSETRRAGF